MSYIRNSVKATVDAYDGTVTLYAQDEQDPVLQAWMKVFPGTVKPKSDISPELQEHLRYPEDLFKVQRALLAKYHVDDPVTFFSTSDFWDVPLDPNPTASSYQPPYYIVAKDLAENDNSTSFQLTSAMNRFRRDFLAAYISASSDPRDVRQDHGADDPRPGQRAQAGVQRDQHRHRGQPGSRCHRPRQPEPDPVGQSVDAAGGARAGCSTSAPVYASPGASDAASSYPRLIRVAMMYNDKIGYGPTVRDALTESVRCGRRRDRDRSGADGCACGSTSASRPPTANPPAAAAPNQQGQTPQTRPEVPVAVPPDRSDAAVGGQSRCAAGCQRRPRCSAGGAAQR